MVHLVAQLHGGHARVAAAGDQLQILGDGRSLATAQMAGLMIAHPAMDASTAAEHPQNVLEGEIIWMA